MSVAKPWMLASPAPMMSHSVEGSPARQCSATITFAGERQGSRTTGAGARKEASPTGLVAGAVIALFWRREPLVEVACGAIRTRGISATQTIITARRARLPGKRICKLVLSVVLIRDRIELHAG